ncbi:HIT domain-containing protein [Melioribacteraceae bacterium 4301-Me]|uniref:HIT family protein n=1 Tax=Pyranulibacter aquaticus TaxID=3163344 RepID=UPI003597A39F
MDKLWSPWRSAYIDSFSKEKKSAACIFCTAAEKKIKSKKSFVVYKGDKSYIMLNLYPYNSGHLMVIPKRHVSDFLFLSEKELAEIMDEIKLSIKALNKIMKPQGFNVGLNLGKAAGAGIDQHVHFHIVPRWNGDTNFMPIIGKVKVISQDLLITKEKLVKEFERLTKEKNNFK